jgi:hypothetical protein
MAITDLAHDTLFTAPIGLEMQQLLLLLLWMHAIYAYITSTLFFSNPYQR